MTTINRNSKADTVFLCDAIGGGGAATLATDLSQYRLSLTNSTTYVWANHARFAVTYPREISCVFTAKNTDVGIIVNHGNAAGTSYTYRVRVNNGVLEVRESGALRTSVILPNVGASLRQYRMQWSTRADGSSIKSELIAYDVTSGTYVQSFGMHTAPTTLTTWDFEIGGHGAGLNGLPIAQIYAVRVGVRFHSQPEFKEDWVTESTPPTISATLRDAPLPGNSTLAAEGQFAGPAYLWAGMNSRQVDRRLISPLVNWRVPDTGTSTLANTFTPAQRFMDAWDNSAYTLLGHTIAYVPVSPKTNRVRARINVNGYTVGAGPCSTQWRLYSVAGIPWAGEAKQNLLYRHSATTTVTLAGGGVGLPGEWVDLGECEIARDDWGNTLFVVACSFDLDSGTTAANDTRLILLGLHIEPMSEPNGLAGGFELELP